MTEKSENFVYVLDGKAYVNLTNRCCNACTFCIRNTGDGVAGTPLWLKREPTADEVMNAYGRVKEKLSSREAVFCGYGEPTEALTVLVECCKRFKALGLDTRLNTNGLGSLSAGRNIAPELKDFDTVSVSLNAPDAESYAAVTRSSYGAAAFDAVLEFAAACRAEGINTVFTVVDTIGADAIAKCRKIAEALNIPLRVRQYVSDNYKGSER